MYISEVTATQNERETLANAGARAVGRQKGHDDGQNEVTMTDGVKDRSKRNKTLTLYWKTIQQETHFKHFCKSVCEGTMDLTVSSSDFVTFDCTL